MLQLNNKKVYEFYCDQLGSQIYASKLHVDSLFHGGRSHPVGAFLTSFAPVEPTVRTGHCCV